MADYEGAQGFPGFWERAEELHDNWGWLLALGILLILFGLFIINYSVFTTFLSVKLLGVFLIVGGVFHILHFFSARRWQGFLLSLISGLLMIVAGGLLFSHPTIGAISLTLLLSIYFIASGFMRLISSVFIRFSNWGWYMLNGVLTTVLGFLILAQWPVTSLYVLGLFLGIDLLFAGMSWLVLGFGAHNLRIRPI